jgi:predicted secreted hydrolase
VRLADARLSQPDPQVERFLLEAELPEGARISLQLDPAKPLVTFGEGGVSRKGDSETAASWYLTFPRLRTEGTLRIAGHTLPVRGESWMDHEISSSQLTPEQAGWDWAGIQLSDGREIMCYRLRRKDGSTDPASALSWVDRNGRPTQVPASGFGWEQRGVWTSPRSKAVYPLPALLVCTDPETGEALELLLKPLSMDQELDGKLTGLAYWEGACEVWHKGRSVGSAYVELTGYANDLSQRLR